MVDFNWLVLIEKLGLPVVALISIAWSFYNCAKWLGVNILLPVQTRHLLFLDRLETGIQKIVDVQHSQNSQIINLTQKISDSMEIKHKEPA